MKDAASSTAMLVARGVAFQSTRHPELVADGETWRRIAGPLPGAWRAALMERLTVPGLSLHYVLRKREIERHVIDAIEDGYDRLTVLGAGFDTLAMRVHRERGIDVTEIDHPATQAVKRRFVPGLRYVAMDFRTGLPAAGGIVVAEALFLYFTAGQVRQILGTLERPVRIVFTFIEPRTPINFQNATFIADAYLRWKNEPMQWAIAPRDLEAFLADEGYTLRTLRLDREYHGEYRGLARGEHVAVAEAR